MRKIASSGKARCRHSLSSRADCEVAAERLLHDDPAPSAQADAAEAVDHVVEERRAGWPGRRAGARVPVEPLGQRLEDVRLAVVARHVAMRPARSRRAPSASTSAIDSSSAFAARSRMNSSSPADDATPMTGMSSRPLAPSRRRPGRSSCAARSPVAPKRTSASAVGASSPRPQCSSPSGVVELDGVAAELVAQRGDHLHRRRPRLLRDEAGEQRGRDDRGGDAEATASLTVQRPSPESAATAAMPSRSGSSSSA